METNNEITDIQAQDFMDDLTALSKKHGIWIHGGRSPDVVARRTEEYADYWGHNVFHEIQLLIPVTENRLNKDLEDPHAS